MDFNPIDIVNNAVNGVGDAVRDVFGLGKTKPTFNDPAHTNLEKFKAEVLGKGLAEEDRFEVFMGKPLCIQGSAFDDIAGASQRIESVSFPPMNILTKQFKVFGPAEQRPIMADYGGDGLVVTYLIDRDMMTKKMFDFWMRCIIDENTQLVSYPDDYTAMLGIRQLDRSDNCTYEAVIQDAFPKSVAPMGLTNTAAGQFHRLQVTFAYRKWTFKGYQASRSDAARTLSDIKRLGGDPIKSVTDQVKGRAATLSGIADKIGVKV